MSYKVIFANDPENPIEVAPSDLFTFIAEQFPKASHRFHMNIHDIMTTRTTPYKNDRFTVINSKTVMTLNLPKFKWPKNTPVNLEPEKGATRIYNEWILFNKKTELEHIFHNLAAIARTMNIDYTYLYSRIKRDSYVVLGEFIFYRTSTLENIYYAEKIKELCKKK